MRILTNNIIESHDGIGMTNSDINYPVENIYDNALEAICKASTGSSVITIAFASDQIVDSLFFGFHNLSSTVFVFKNSVGTVLDTVTFSSPASNAKEYIDELTTVRSIEITLTSSEVLAFIGGVSCGKYAEVYNVRLPIEVEYVDSSAYTQTSGGQFLYRTGFILQAFTVESMKIDDDQVDEFIAAFSYVHKGKTFWMDRTEDTEDQMFCAFVSNYLTTRINELTLLRFSVKEAK